MTTPNCAGAPGRYLMPGEFYFSGEPEIVQTVLGSCVSIVMFSPRKRIGAICHCVLPVCEQEGRCNAPCSEGFKYVWCAVRHMLGRFARHGINRGEIEVKIFGGAEMLDGRAEISVGRQNVEVALRCAESMDLKVSAIDVGDSSGRKILFHTNTGEVFLKRLQKAS